MLSLEDHHIIDLYVAVDDLLPRSGVRVGRPAKLCTSEIITILVWNILNHTRQQTLKDVYRWVRQYHRAEFPQLPQYTKFVEACHRSLPALWHVLEQVLVTTARVRCIDATMLPVCKLIRADQHKVAKSIADFGKNWQGWHYGFKLHASINLRGQLAGIALTPANIYDPQMMPWILNAHTDIAVGDTLYGATMMRRKIWKDYGCVVFAPPHPNQRKKLMTWWQGELLKMRPKIETVFDYLKNHLHLVSSFPRSVNGYLLHYLRILLGYQIYTLTLAQ